MLPLLIFFLSFFLFLPCYFSSLASYSASWESLSFLSFSPFIEVLISAIHFQSSFFVSWMFFFTAFSFCFIIQYTNSSPRLFMVIFVKCSSPWLVHTLLFIFFWSYIGPDISYWGFPPVSRGSSHHHTSGADHIWASLRNGLAGLLAWGCSQDRLFRSFLLCWSYFSEMFFVLLPGDNKPSHQHSKKKAGVLNTEL